MVGPPESPRPAPNGCEKPPLNPPIDPVALVTGASSGLGRGLARSLAGEGYAVALVARRESLLDHLAAEILDGGGRVGVFPADVSERRQVRRAAQDAEAQLGPIDLLIANAGIHVRSPDLRVMADDVEATFAVNVLGAVYAVEAVLPGMLERGRGHLVCVSSLAAYGGLPGSAAYSASKAALTSYFEALRIELRTSGIDVTVLSPGFVRTPLTAQNAARRPFILECDDAVDRMVRAILDRRRAHSFPWPLATLVRVGRLLPRFLYDAVLSARR